MIESSVIIPVCNKWDLTRKCLKSIASNTDTSRIEVIVIDNASSDDTPKGCPFLGQRFFGDFFRYIRNDANRNFAGASNQGAEAARGEFIVFLNNDTEVQPGWYQPLIDDFAAYSDIGATGPLLVYPEKTFLGQLVQHLGVYVSPSFALGHLYEGIPAKSPLAGKRRFFQAITAACMTMKRTLFLEAGKFDERFINGFEDVDLCARLKEKGYRFTVNPVSVVVHHESQTPGRHAREGENSRLLAEKSLECLEPDWHLHAAADGMYLGINQWLLYQNMLPETRLDKLSMLAARAGRDALAELVTAYPYWQEGWEKILAMTEGANEKLSVFKPYLKLFRNPENAFRAYELGKKVSDTKLSAYGETLMRAFAISPHAYLQLAFSGADICEKAGMEEMARRQMDWMRQFNDFAESIYPAFASQFVRMASETGNPLMTQDDNAYAIWSCGKRKAEVVPAEEKTGFSLIMPVYNPDGGFFRAALDSILAQTYANWELCIADDASTTPETAEIIREYMERDSRVKAVFRENNGHIAEATNSAIELAEKEWCVPVDHDDLLAPDALAVMNLHILKKPDGMLFYSDEDKVAGDDYFFQPYFKKGKWDSELLVSQNFVCHLAAYRTERLKEIGGFRKCFEGAQDHDLVLRYTDGIDAENLVHIPRVLYHWRVHDRSTAQDIQAKGYAFGNTVKAVSEWLGSRCPGASVDSNPVIQWARVSYPVPSETPLVSIICRIPHKSFDRQAFITAAARSAAYPHEIIFVSAEAENGFVMSENEAVMSAKGEIVGFIDPGLIGASRNWLAELVSVLWRNGAGAVGGKAIVSGECVAHAGYLTDATGLLRPLFPLSSAREGIYFGWNILQGTVDALDGLCMFTRKQSMLESNLLSAGMGAWAIQDYCLRLGRKGLRSIWWPHVQMFFGEWTPSDATDAFTNAWRGILAPFNENAVIEKDGLALCTG